MRPFSKMCLVHAQAIAQRVFVQQALWLKESPIEDEGSLEARGLLQELSLAALQPVTFSEQPIVNVRLPEAPTARKRIQKLLEPLKPQISANGLHLNRQSYIRYVQEQRGVPIMRIDLERQEVLLGLHGELKTLTDPLPEPSLLNKDIDHMEAYIRTVERGQSQNPKFAKTSMFEALLYMFSTPFAHEYMKGKRAAYGAIDRRGPRLLYIYGRAQNGKSTFLRFALKLLTGSIIEPLSRGDFTKSRVRDAATFGTVFPLVFDDVNLSQVPGIEDLIKSYWEVWWGNEFVQPQIILSSNTARLKDWAKSRVKRVDFDVHFTPDESNKRVLNALFSTENSIFKWFSYLYIQRLKSAEPVRDDEVHLARLIMKEL